MSNATDDPLAEARAEVQRLFGHCLLRLQGYEILVKAILTRHHLYASATEVAQPRAACASDVDRQTLGLLVGQMLTSFFVAGEPERTVKAVDDDPAFEMRFWIGLQPADFSKVEADLRDLVALRNRLVHHFLEEHELRSLQGCDVARSALVEDSARIGRAMQDLRSWAADLQRAQSAVVQFLNSTDFRDALIGEAIPWPMTTIVQALREAERALARDGWAPVPKAADWISKHHPDEQPASYLCRSWRQMVHESRLFDLRYRRLGDGRREAWYRSRTDDIGARCEPTAGVLA